MVTTFTRMTRKYKLTGIQKKKTVLRHSLSVCEPQYDERAQYALYTLLYTVYINI